MNPIELHDARRTLGEMWGLDRPLTMAEMGRVLRLGGKDPGVSIRDYEAGKTAISGPLSLVLALLLEGAEPDPPEFWRRDLVDATVTATLEERALARSAS
jgi:hypothetical protein